MDKERGESDPPIVLNSQVKEEMFM